MIILHNPFDKDSRAFVARYRSGNLVIDWSDYDAREKFFALADHRRVSAFPSVVVHVPPHTIPAHKESGETIPERHVPGHHHIVRTPQSMDDVRAALDTINATLRSAGVAALAESDLDRSDNRYQHLSMRRFSKVA